MTGLVLLVVVAGLIGGFSYFTNAGFGDRRPKSDRRAKEEDQPSADDEDAPPPSK